METQSEEGLLVRRCQDTVNQMACDFIEISTESERAKMVIWVKSPYAPTGANSIVSFVFDEQRCSRNLKVKMLRYAAELFDYKDLGNQVNCSDRELIAVHFEAGFRCFPAQTLEETYELIKWNPSIYMQYVPQKIRTR